MSFLMDTLQARFKPKCGKRLFHTRYYGTSTCTEGPTSYRYQVQNLVQYRYLLVVDSQDLHVPVGVSYRTVGRKSNENSAVPNY
jgi:hypothetical protein